MRSATQSDMRSAAAGHRCSGSRLRCGWQCDGDLSAFSSRFDFQRLSALSHKCASAFCHFVYHLIIMTRVVMEKQELVHIGIKRQRNYAAERTMAPADVLRVLVVRILGI